MVFGVFNGMVQGSVFGLAGVLPGKYMGAVMFGNGVSGVGCNLLRLIFVASFPKPAADASEDEVNKNLYL